YPEVDVTKSPVHHPPEHFREPVINTRQHSEERRASHHQVEVCHNKVSVVQLDIDRRVSKEYPGDTTCKEERHHTDGEQHRRCEPDVTLPKRGDVVEYLNSRRNCNNQRQQHEDRSQERVHPRHEHVVRPNHEGQYCDEQHRSHHRLIAEDGLAAVRSNDFRSNPQGGKQHDVHFRVTEEPEQVLEEDRATSYVG